MDVRGTQPGSRPGWLPIKHQLLWRQRIFEIRIKVRRVASNPRRTKKPQFIVSAGCSRVHTLARIGASGPNEGYSIRLRSRDSERGERGGNGFPIDNRENYTTASCGLPSTSLRPFGNLARRPQGLQYVGTISAGFHRRRGGLVPRPILLPSCFRRRSRQRLSRARTRARAWRQA